MGVLRSCVLTLLMAIMPRFPNTVTEYMVRKRRNRGTWRSGYSEKPKRMKVTEVVWFSWSLSAGNSCVDQDDLEFSDLCILTSCVLD